MPELFDSERIEIQESDFLPSTEWPYYEMWRVIKTLLLKMPEYFESSLVLSGMSDVREIYKLGQLLSGIVEEEFVRTLNELQEHWNPEKRFGNLYFFRQPEAFPDVILGKEGEESPIMGIELKTWYLLSKEKEPSFRFKVTSDACAPQDLLVVVPWVLSEVISGSPTIFRPWVKPAKYVAEYRNYWWQSVRNAKGKTGITRPPEVGPYPRSRDRINDEPESDSGGNFGRIARTGIMDKFVEEMLNQKVLGIEINRWIEFLIG